MACGSIHPFSHPDWLGIAVSYTLDTLPEILQKPVKLTMDTRYDVLSTDTVVVVFGYVRLKRRYATFLLDMQITEEVTRDPRRFIKRLRKAITRIAAA